MYNNNDYYPHDMALIATQEIERISSQELIQPVKKDVYVPVRKDVIAAPITHPSIWESLSKEFKIEANANTEEVQKEIRSLLKDPNRLYQILQSSSPYIYYIYSRTKSNNLPAELSLIPVIESEYNPYDKSNKGATGLWQLMSVTAHQLGVSIKNGYDGRRNVILSTEAALAYFKDLGTLFHGDWYLAIAAYNGGQNMVQSAIRKAGSKDFWRLKVPKETKVYVPKLLALAEIIKHPNKYHFKLPYISDAPYFAKLETKKNINLKRLALATGLNLETLSRLNPDYTKGSSPYSNKNKIFLVPIERENVAKYYLTT